MHVEKNSRLFSPSGRIRIDSTPMYLFVLIPLWCMLTNLADSSTSHWSRVASLLVAGILTLSGVGFVVRRSRYSYPYEFVKIAPERLYVRVKGYADIVIDWASVDRISVSRFHELVLIHKDGAKRPIWIPRFFWPKKMPLDEFVSQFENALNHYRSR